MRGGVAGWDPRRPCGSTTGGGLTSRDVGRPGPLRAPAVGDPATTGLSAPVARDATPGANRRARVQGEWPRWRDTLKHAPRLGVLARIGRLPETATLSAGYRHYPQRRRRVRWRLSGAAPAEILPCWPAAWPRHSFTRHPALPVPLLLTAPLQALRRPVPVGARRSPARWGPFERRSR
jgi:hypothetical protein